MRTTAAFNYCACKFTEKTYNQSNICYTLKGGYQTGESSMKHIRKTFQKANISYPLVRMCAYKGVRNVSFSENFAYVLNGWPLAKEKVIVITITNLFWQNDAGDLSRCYFETFLKEIQS